MFDAHAVRSLEFNNNRDEEINVFAFAFYIGRRLEYREKQHKNRESKKEIQFLIFYCYSSFRCFIKHLQSYNHDKMIIYIY